MREDIFPPLRDVLLLLILPALPIRHQLPPPLGSLMVELLLQILRALPEEIGEGVVVADHEDEEEEGGDDDAGRGDVVQHPVQAEGESQLYLLE